MTCYRKKWLIFHETTMQSKTRVDMMRWAKKQKWYLDDNLPVKLCTLVKQTNILFSYVWFWRYKLYIKIKLVILFQLMIILAKNMFLEQQQQPDRARLVAEDTKHFVFAYNIIYALRHRSYGGSDYFHVNRITRSSQPRPKWSPCKFYGLHRCYERCEIQSL